MQQNLKEGAGEGTVDWVGLGAPPSGATGRGHSSAELRVLGGRGRHRKIIISVRFNLPVVQDPPFIKVQPSPSYLKKQRPACLSPRLRLSYSIHRRCPHGFLCSALGYLALYAVLRDFSHVLLGVTLWTVASQAPLSMGFSRQEYWSGSPHPPPGDLPDSRIEPASLSSPALQGGFFTTSAS